ncbi:MAG: cytosine permease [Actinomycetota bacterium]|nr:cytosine permease [Actinomycetota bacterium]
MTIASQGASPSPVTGDDTRAFRVEQRGTDFVPEDQRWARPRDLFAMWCSSSLQFEYLIYGAVLMTFGFSFAQAAVLIVVGNLSYLLLGLCSLQGPETGTTVFVIGRAAYGPNGSRIMATFNWLTQVGFETEGLTLATLAAVALAAKAGWHTTTGTKVIIIVAAAAVQGVLPLFGHASIIKALRVLIAPFMVLYVILAVLTVHKAHLSAPAHGVGWQTIVVGMTFVITLSGLGWVENGNDFSRYLPRQSSKPAILGWVLAGAAIPQVVVMLLGAAVATYVPSAAGDPVHNFPHAFAAWFLVPFLVVAIMQVFAISSLDLYSSGVTLQAIGLPLRRWQAVLLDTVIAAGLTAYAVFSSSFNTLLSDFVSLVVAWIAPWMAVFLVDWALRRYRYVPGELQRTDPGSLYWRSGGIHWPAIMAQVLGSAVALLSINTNFYVSPLSHATDGADFSILAGVVVAGAAYALIGGRGVRRQADLQDQLLEVPALGPTDLQDRSGRS